MCCYTARLNPSLTFFPSVLRFYFPARLLGGIGHSLLFVSVAYRRIVPEIRRGMLPG